MLTQRDAHPPTNHVSFHGPPLVYFGYCPAFSPTQGYWADYYWVDLIPVEVRHLSIAKTSSRHSWNKRQAHYRFHRCYEDVIPKIKRWLFWSGIHRWFTRRHEKELVFMYSLFAKLWPSPNRLTRSLYDCKRSCSFTLTLSCEKNVVSLQERRCESVLEILIDRVHH